MTGPIERKVRISTAASGVLGLVLAVITWVQDRPDVLAPLPQWAQGAILLVVVPAVTGIAGLLAPHTPRDLDAEAQQKAQRAAEKAQTKLRRLG